MMQRRAGRRWLAAGLVCLAWAASTSNHPCQAQVAEPPQVRWIRPVPGAATIFGSDSRRQVQDTTQFPWSAIGQVIAYFGDTIHVGSGAMIGNKTVLTAAHVVAEPGLGTPDRIEFIPGLNGQFEPFGRATVDVRVVPQSWANSGAEGSDIAVLVLNESIGDQTGFLQIDVPAASFFEDLPLESAGYPSDRGGDFMYTAPGDSLGVDGNFLLETIDTEPGQSGSAVWFEDPDTGEPRVVGVIKGTREINNGLNGNTQQGVAVRITSEYANLIRDTLETYGDPQDIPNGPPGDGMQCGNCGAGTGQALLACTLGYTACFLARRRRM